MKLYLWCWKRLERFNPCGGDIIDIYDAIKEGESKAHVVCVKLKDGRIVLDLSANSKDLMEILKGLGWK